jgi:hypothetical protein
MSALRRTASRGRVLLLVAALLAPVPAQAVLLDHEYNGAFDQLGWLRMQAQRISRQNLLYQLHLADQHKLELLDTVNKFNESLDVLRSGGASIGIPVPPTPEIREQLEKIAESWSPMESMALASPYDYLRRSREFFPPKNDRGDPLLITHFDRMAEQVVADIEGAIALYIAQCKQDGYQRCDLGEAAAVSEMRAERLVKEAVFVFAGMNPKENRTRLARTRAELREVILRSGESPAMVDAKAVVEQALAPDRGSQNQAIRDLATEIESSWRRLDREIELVDRGHAEEANLRRALNFQQILVGDLQRLSAAIRAAGIDYSVR